MKAEKEFDAVKTMREIRDTISREIQEMSFEEEREYIQNNLKSRSEEGHGNHAVTGRARRA
jgi:hypothetical protein